MTGTMAPEAVPLLSVRKLTKLFGNFAACNGIDLDIARVKSTRFWVKTAPANPRL